MNEQTTTLVYALYARRASSRRQFACVRPSAFDQRHSPYIRETTIFNHRFPARRLASGNSSRQPRVQRSAIGVRAHQQPPRVFGLLTLLLSNHKIVIREYLNRLLQCGHFTCTEYDTRCYFNVCSKADMSQFNLPHGKTTKKCKTEKLRSKNGYARSNSKSLGNHIIGRSRFHRGMFR